MYFVDSPGMRDGSVTCLVVLDRVHAGPEALWRDLAERLGAEVLGARVLEVDYVRETTRVEVRHRPLATPTLVPPLTAVQRQDSRARQG